MRSKADIISNAVAYHWSSESQLVVSVVKQANEYEIKVVIPRCFHQQTLAVAGRVVLSPSGTHRRTVLNHPCCVVLYKPAAEVAVVPSPSKLDDWAALNHPCYDVSSSLWFDELAVLNHWASANAHMFSEENYLLTDTVMEFRELSEDLIRTRRNRHKLIQHHCHYDLRKFNFTNRVIPI